MKQVKINIQYGKPIEITEEDNSSENQEPFVSTAIGLTLKEYQKKVQMFLNGNYANQKDLVLPYLQKPCNIFVFICNDGVFVRYDDVKAGEDKVRTTKIEKDLFEIAPIFSDGVLHFPGEFSSYIPEIRGPLILLEKSNSNQTEVQKVLEFHYEIFAKLEYSEGHKIEPPNRPIPYVSLSNQLRLNLCGIFQPPVTNTKEIIKEEEFLTDSKFFCPVGWLAIEIYPLLPDDNWKPEYTTLWAELDILSLIAKENTRIKSLNEYDSRFKVRKYYSNLIREFQALLNGLEEPVHQFLKQHPEILCPTHEKCWSKVPFGNTVSDFVFRESYNDYQLVEIEAPIRELFRQDGQQRQELTHAINQISDWIQYIQDNKLKVEDELGLVGISTNPRTLVVIGRSEKLSTDNRRKLETLQSQQNKLRIMTYDDVLQNAKESLGRIFGTLDLVGQNVDIYYSGKK